jgi:hypothetical protein|tara:strand:+ start:637 stop:1296 length:660 start_codon:yes stop_codon:yes gene_type:complete
MKTFTKIIIASSIGLLSFQGEAQTIAIKGGVNFSKIANDDVFGGAESGFTTSFNPGFHVGATVDLPITKMFSVETGLFATTSGLKYKASFQDFGFVYDYRVAFNLLNAEIPVIFKSTFEVGENFNIYVGAGGYGAFSLFGTVKSRINIMGQVESDSEVIDFNDLEDDRFDAGLRFDAGIEVKGFIVGASYNFGLAPTIFEGQNRIIKVSLGYRFGWNKA